MQGFYLSAKSKNTLAANEFLVNYIGARRRADRPLRGRQPSAGATAAYEKARPSPIIKGFGDVGANGAPMPSIPEMGSVWRTGASPRLRSSAGRDPAATWTKMATDIQAKIDG